MNQSGSYPNPPMPSGYGQSPARAKAESLDHKGLSLTGIGGLVLGVVLGLILTKEKEVKAQAQVAGTVRTEPEAAARPEPAQPGDSAQPEPAKPGDPAQPEPAAQPEPGDSAQPVDPQPAEVAATRAILDFDVAGSPAGLTIEVNGKDATGGIELDISKGPATVEVVARAKGFKTWRETLTVEADKTVAVSLEKSRPVTRPKGKGKPKRGKPKGKGKKPTGPGGMISL
jgi:hypothetical protein